MTRTRTPIHSSRLRRLWLWTVLTLKTTLMPFIALVTFLSIGIVYFFVVHRDEEFVQKLGAVLLIPDYDWADSFTVAYSFLGQFFVFGWILTFVGERLNQARDPLFRSRRLVKMQSNPIIIIGYGNLGKRLVAWCLENHKSFVVIDINLTRLQPILGKCAVLNQDASDIATLQKAGLDSCSTVISTSRQHHLAVNIAKTLRNANYEGTALIRCFDDRIQQVIERLGCQVFSTSKWLLQHLLLEFPSKAEDAVLIVGCNSLGRRVAEHCYRKGQPFAALDRDPRACHLVYQSLCKLDKRSNSATTRPAPQTALATGGFGSTANMTSNGSLLYQGKSYAIVQGSATADEALMLGASSLHQDTYAAVFIFVSAFEDALACCEIVLRQCPQAKVHVRIFDEMVESVFEDLSLPDDSAFAADATDASRVKTFSSSLQAFEKIVGLLEGKADLDGSELRA